MQSNDLFVLYAILEYMVHLQFFGGFFLCLCACVCVSSFFIMFIILG